MKIYIVILLSIMLNSCNGQEKNKKEEQTTQKHTEMTVDTFDIETFNKNKINNEYNFVLEDETNVRQFGGEDNYVEYRIKKNLLGTYKEFYFPSGKLKTLSTIYFNEFDIRRKEYDETGKLIDEINYDEPYKFTFEQLSELIKKEKDTINLLDKNTKITRESIEDGTFWYITYKKDWGRREVIKVDGITGEILERSHYPHEDN